MSRVILAEVREIVLLASMLLALSATALVFAGAAVVITENQTQHVAAYAPLSAIGE